MKNHIILGPKMEYINYFNQGNSSKVLQSIVGEFKFGNVCSESMIFIGMFDEGLVNFHLQPGLYNYLFV